MTRGTLMTLVDEMADASGSPRWGTTLKRQLLGEVHWREWKDLLNVNRMLRVAPVTVTTDGDGRFAKTALNTGAGDSAQAFYRVLSVNSGNFYYQPARYEDYPRSPTSVSLPQVWYEYGDDIQIIPATTSAPVTVVVNHVPQRADLLDTDASTVVFPEGYDLVIAYECAASMLMKGAAESNLAAELRQMARVLRERMHQDVGRMTVQPMRVRAMDDRFDWGAV